MLKIGEFSQLGQVSVRTLRLYDELGLLRPVYINPDSEYRYYSIEQLPTLHRIVALKELGLPLGQIGCRRRLSLPSARPCRTSAR